MKFMVMHKHDQDVEAGKLPSPEFIEAMGALVGGMAQAGKLLDGDGLGASKTRSRVVVEGGKRSVVHGPFVGRNELPAAFAKITVGSREEAIEVATKMAHAIGGDLELEVSKLTEAWDLGLCEKPAGAPERYLVIHKATPATEAGDAPNLEAIAKGLGDKGVLNATVTLAPSSRAKRLTWRGGTRKVIDGPFAESKELIGGFVILDVADMDECMAYCAQYADLMLTARDDLEIDIRPL